MDIDCKNDIYFDPRLGEIYAALGNGVFHEFNYECGAGKVRHQFIIRPVRLPSVPALDREAGDIHDITTPYGYGGPMIMEEVPGRRRELLEGFAESFGRYCRDRAIVSEFIRFHPIAGNALDFSDIYQVKRFNRTIGINLADYDDPVQEEFSKSARKRLRQCLRDGLACEIEEYPDSLRDFSKIYYQTMDRNEAEAAYYFDDSYFEAFVAAMPENILKCKVTYEEEVIAMGFYLRSDQILHTHLSGTLTEYLHLSPAYVLRYALVEWGKERGYKLIHTGGGTTGHPEDSLYLFKRKFGKNTEFDFYLGRKVWDRELYDKLVRVTGTKGSSFFPEYRAKA